MFPSADLPLPSIPSPALRVRGVDAVLALLGTSEEPPDHGTPSAFAKTSGTAESPARPGSTAPSTTLSTQEAAPRTHASDTPAVAVRSGQTPTAGQAAHDPLAGIKEHVSLGTIARALAAATTTGTPSALAPLPLPAIGAPVEEPARFAGALESAVRTSGVFYESHLLDWVEGRTTLEAVRAEPRAAATDNATTRTAMLPGAELPIPGRLEPLATGAAQAPAEPPAGYRPEAVTNAQLHCAETNEVHITTEVWPGQIADMVLRTPERGPRQQGGNLVEPALPGSGVLKLSLPQLGDVEARIHTEGNEVRYTLNAKNPVSASKLRSATAALAYGLGMAGLKLVSANVDDHPD